MSLLLQAPKSSAGKNALLVVLALSAPGCGTTPTGSIEANATVEACPTVSTLVAIGSKASIKAPSNTSTIYASASAPNPAKLRYAFSITSGTGMLSDQKIASNTIGTSSSVVFTCPDREEVDTIRIVTSDEKGPPCPVSLTTAMTTVTCEAAR
jgi:hypothetical protein